VLIFAFFLVANQVFAKSIPGLDNSVISNAYNNFINKVSEIKNSQTSAVVNSTVIRDKKDITGTTLDDYKKYVSWQARNLSSIMKNSFANYYDSYTSGLALVLYPPFGSSSGSPTLTKVNTTPAKATPPNLGGEENKKVTLSSPPKIKTTPKNKQKIPMTFFKGKYLQFLPILFLFSLFSLIKHSIFNSNSFSQI
jgi:hypothetical protein